MKNQLTICYRVFHVRKRDERTGWESWDTIALTKEQLRAAQTIGQSSKELIYRTFNKDGYKVLEIGDVEKRSFTVDLTDMSLHLEANAVGQ